MSIRTTHRRPPRISPVAVYRARRHWQVGWFVAWTRLRAVRAARARRAAEPPPARRPTMVSSARR